MDSTNEANVKYNVLFLGTSNAARSIMAEAILKHLGKHHFNAFSAGSFPAQVDPLTLNQIKRANLPVDLLRSKSWDEFARPDAPQLDFVITVCDKAAGEVCPVWPGHPVTAHWNIKDPAALEGSDDKKLQAFSLAFSQLNRRISIFVNLPFNKLNELSLKKELEIIGQLPEQRKSPRDN